VKVGVRIPSVPPFDRMRRLVSRLAEGGADSFWWADHLMAFSAPSLWEGREDAPDEMALHVYADPFVCMAACAEAAGDADVGTCVTDAVRRMPATLLQSALSVDHLVAGRVILGIGAGEVANYRPYGWDVASPAARFEEAARAIRGLMEHPEPDEAGAIMGLRPAKGTGPELWLAAHGPHGLALAGELADGWIPTNLDLARWTAARDSIRSAERKAGRREGSVELGLSIDVVLQDSHAQAHELLRHPAIRSLCLLLPDEVFANYGMTHPLGGSALHNLIATRSGPTLLKAVNEIDDDLVHDHILHGSPDEVGAVLASYPGLDHVRMSDLSGIGGIHGGVARLLAVVGQLHTVARVST
jgi:phthiodiolone/phenolphthiodiolone dimycocerosates ketoreductase